MSFFKFLINQQPRFNLECLFDEEADPDSDEFVYKIFDCKKREVIFRSKDREKTQQLSILLNKIDKMDINISDYDKLTISISRLIQ